MLRLTYFQNNISDLINFKFASPNSTYENIGRVRTTGLEAALNVEVAKNLYAFANYTLNNPKIVDDSNTSIKGNELSFRGASSFNFGLAYETPRGFYAGILLHNIGKFFTNNTNTESLPAYTTVDFKLRFPLGQKLTINGSLDNIFDQQYQVYPGYPGIGRSARIGLNLTF